MLACGGPPASADSASPPAEEHSMRLVARISLPMVGLAVGLALSVVLYRGTFARSSANQPSTMAIRGWGCSTGSLVIRNRSPSGETS